MSGCQCLRLKKKKRNSPKSVLFFNPTSTPSCNHCIKNIRWVAWRFTSCLGEGLAACVLAGILVSASALCLVERRSTFAYDFWDMLMRMGFSRCWGLFCGTWTVLALSQIQGQQVKFADWEMSREKYSSSNGLLSVSALPELSSVVEPLASLY